MNFISYISNVSIPIIIVIIMRTIEWEDNKLKLIDQTKLPDELTYVYCSTYQEVIDAIKTMVVRGAPAIGVSAAFGMALAQLAGEDMEKVAMEDEKIKALVEGKTVVKVVADLPASVEVINVIAG